MSHDVAVTLNIHGASRPLALTFGDDEWENLRAYAAYARQLDETRLVREGGNSELKITYSADSGLTYTGTSPPEDDLLAVLHRIRPFVLQNEPTWFHGICNMLARHIEDADVRSFLKNLRRRFDAQRLRDLTTIRMNDVVINADKTLMKWLNAHEYHKDRDKQRELAELHGLLPLEASRVVFTMMIFDKVEAIFVAAELIETILGSQRQVEF